MSAFLDSAEDAAKSRMIHERVPAWMAVLCFVLFSIVGFAATIAWDRASKAADDVQDSRSRISVLESEHAGFKQWLEKIDAKMDKLFDEVRRTH